MAGLKTELLDSLQRNSKTRRLIERSQLQKNHDAGIEDTVKILHEAAEQRDILKLFNSERLLLVHLRQTDANSPEEVKSLEAAINQLDESIECFKAIQADPAAYKKMAATYPSKHKEAGLPMDAAREFFRSHTTRLNNSLAAKGTDSEKNLLRQRKENLKVIRECYIEFQKQAMDLQGNLIWKSCI
jgi:glutamine synthetase adenylyltransferase